MVVINGVGVVLVGEGGRELWSEGKGDILRQFRASVIRNQVQAVHK